MSSSGETLVLLPNICFNMQIINSVPIYSILINNKKVKLCEMCVVSFYMYCMCTIKSSEYIKSELIQLKNELVIKLIIIIANTQR